MAIIWLYVIKNPPTPRYNKLHRINSFQSKTCLIFTVINNHDTNSILILLATPFISLKIFCLTWLDLNLLSIWINCCFCPRFLLPAPPDFCWSSSTFASVSPGSMHLTHLVPEMMMMMMEWSWQELQMTPWHQLQRGHGSCPLEIQLVMIFFLIQIDLEQQSRDWTHTDFCLTGPRQTLIGQISHPPCRRSWFSWAEQPLGIWISLEWRRVQLVQTLLQARTEVLSSLLETFCSSPRPVTACSWWGWAWSWASCWRGTCGCSLWSLSCLLQQLVVELEVGFVWSQRGSPDLHRLYSIFWCFNILLFLIPGGSDGS